MGQKRIYRTLEYSARVARLSVTSRATIEAALPDVRPSNRQWQAGPNIIYMIGDWLDASRPRRRAWWFLTLLFYLVGGVATMAGALPLVVYAQSLGVLVIVLGFGLMIGAGWGMALQLRNGKLTG